MKVSVITASFNQGAFIGRCLASVREQASEVEVEHIVLDNCSSDSTGEALDAYRVNTGRVSARIFIEPDGGQTAAINKGFQLATGDVVCWLNTDEWYESGALARVVQFFKTHPDVDVVFGDCRFVNDQGKLVKHKREYFFSASMLKYYGCYLPSCATFVRRHAIDAGFLLDPTFKVTMDLDWYVRLAGAGYRFAHVSEILASFTWHDTNISLKFVERRLTERRLVLDRYSGVRGPGFLRATVYHCMRHYWLAIRIMRRCLGTLQRAFA